MHYALLRTTSDPKKGVWNLYDTIYIDIYTLIYGTYKCNIHSYKFIQRDYYCRGRENAGHLWFIGLQLNFLIVEASPKLREEMC